SQRNHLTDLAADGQHRPWWAGYASLLPAGTGAYLDLEAAAVHIRSFSASLIPDLLQTKDYAQAAWRAARPGLTSDQARALAAVLHRRRDHLSADRIHLIADEHALLRPVTSARVMAPQLDRLLPTTAASTAITLQITP